MKVKIGNALYDSEKEPIMLVFSGDEQREQVAAHLTSMVPRPGMIRKYVQAPDSMGQEELYEFMKLEE